MSNTCPECKTELKELLFSRYCPNEENHGKGAFFKAIDKATEVQALASQLPPFQLSNNTWNLQSPHQIPKVYTQRMNVLATGWSHNAQSRKYYTNFILFAPSPVVLGINVRCDNPTVVAFVSGQHISGSGKKTEITIVAEALSPVNAVIELEVVYP